MLDTISVVHRACTFLLATNCVYSCLFSMGMVQDLHTIELVFTWEWYRICRVPFPYYLHLIWEWYRICTQQNFSYAKYKLYSVQILYLHCTIVPLLYHSHAYAIQICAKIFICLLKILFYKHSSEITVIVCLGFSPNYQIIMWGPSQGVSDAPHVIIW